MNKQENFTVDELLNVGLNQIAYIKELGQNHNGSFGFSIHAADGTQISVMDSYDMAVAAVRMNDLYPVTVH